MSRPASLAPVSLPVTHFSQKSINSIGGVGDESGGQVNVWW